MIAYILTGTFVVETIFGIPGMGRFFVTSISGRDYPVIMGAVLLFAIFLVLAMVYVGVFPDQFVALTEAAARSLLV